MTESTLDNSKPFLKTTHLRLWRELALVALMLMEISWVVPWFRSLTPQTYAASEGISFIYLFCLMLGAHVITRGMNGLNLKMSIRRGITIALIIGSVLIGYKLLLYPGESLNLLELMIRPFQSFSSRQTLIPDEFVIAIVILIGWWRGIALAQAHIGPSYVTNHLIFGVIMFLFYGFLNTLLTNESPGFMLELFIFSGLMAMSSARLATLGYIRGGQPSTFDRRWFLSMVLAGLAVMSLVALISRLAGGQAAWVNYVILFILGFFAIILWLIFYPVLILLLRLLEAMPDVSGALLGLQERLAGLQAALNGLLNLLSQKLDDMGVTAFFARYAPGVKSILLWSVLIAVVGGILLWLALSIWKDNVRKKIHDEQNSILESGDFWRLLQEALRLRWRKLWGSAAQLANLNRSQRLRAAARIRQIYIDLLELGEDLGQPRPPADTPLEYLPTLYDLFPDLDGEADAITQAYLRVRYGQLPETTTEVEQVELSWKRIQEAGNQLKSEKKEKITASHRA